jgi:anaerobic selenocysteine-containing dehydrogenase
MTTTPRAEAQSGRRTLHTMCPMNCMPTICGMVVEIEDDHVVSIRGDAENPDSRGFLCIRGQSAGEIVDNPLRLQHPRVRERRAPDAWRDTSWDEALDRIADTIRRVGPEAVGVWSYHGAVVNLVPYQLAARFANVGGFQGWNGAMICWGMGAMGLHLTGPIEVNTKEDMGANAELILLWGANFASQPTTAPHVVAARKRGAHVVAIDVRRSEAFAQADETYLIRPGTDAALALAMIHVVIGEGLYDTAFVAAHTDGFTALTDHVVQYTPEWAAGETGIPAEAIRELARRYASTKRSMILLGGSSMHKSANGWLAGRAVGCLPALTGALGRAGGGFGVRHGARSTGAGLGNIAGAELRPPAPSGEYIPPEMSTILEAMEEGRIKVLLVLGANILSSFADAGRVARAMEQMDCIVSHDLFMNDTARQVADVVLPGTSWLEDTGFKVSNTHLYLMDQGLSPRGETRSGAWVLRELATRLGMTDFFPWKDTDAMLTAAFDHPATGHITAEQLREQGGRQALAVSPVAHPDLRFGTPSGKVEFYSERAVEMGLPPLPVYEPLAEDAGADPERAERYPLLFCQGRTLTHFHSFYDHGQALPSLKKADPEPRLWINPADATARGLADGDRLRMCNERGEMEARAQVTEKVPAGVVWMRDGWLGVNQLTSGARAIPDDAARRFPGGQAAYEARVQVARV